MASQATQLPQSGGEIQQCIQICLDCHRICHNTMMTYCLQQGGHYAESKHVQLMLDCAEICQTSANFMIRSSDLHYLTCQVCADVCDRCAEQCEQFTDDVQMQVCAEKCRQCATSCRQMVAMAG